MDLTVPYAVKVPVDRALRLRDRLEQLLKAQKEDERKLNLKIKAGKATPEEQRMVVDRRRKLSDANMIRAAVAQGLTVLESMTDAELIKHLDEEGLVRGRPRAA